MANVVDPNSWRMIPPPDPDRPLQPAPTAEPQSSGEAPSGRAEAAAGLSRSAIAELAIALRRTFGGRQDHVVWNLAPPPFPQAPGGGYRRVDAQHETIPPAALLATAHQEEPAGKPWLVIVEDAHSAIADERFVRLKATSAAEPQFLLVACNVDDPHAAPSRSLAAASARALAIAGRLGCQYVGPIAVGDAEQLAETLSQIKQHGQPTLLHLDARPPAAPPPPHFAARGAPSADEQVLRELESPRTIAARALAQLARSDERIVAVATAVDPAMANAWQGLGGRLYPVDSDVAHALAWCAGLASSGSRPFAFLGCDEAQDSLGRIREICLAGAGVTLVLESRGPAESAGSSSLAGILQLPAISALAPKDATELAKMLAWCAGQSDPAVIWLGGDFAPDADWPWTVDIERGRAEELNQGRDVAIVAWGPMVAAASVAAESLALSGLEVSVVNARFARPLDVESIVRIARGATYVVLVDDVEQTGGFAGWVLEQLSRAGLAQPTAIVAPPADRRDPRDLYNRCALAIVERCRWLAEPIVPSVTIEPLLPAPEEDPRTLAGNWQRFIGRHAERTARERAQVQARQLSRDVARWVATYEDVGSRDVYLWQWCSHGVELTTLPCVVPELRAHVCDTKMLSIVLCVLLDDVADQHGSSFLLDALLEMTCWGTCRTQQELNADERRHAEIARAFWAEYLDRIRSYPAYATYEPVLRFDLLQSFNTMRYSHLVNSRPYLLNMAEHDLYTPHNMMQTSFATLDLMCSPRFPLAEVGALREAVYHAQCMGRIGNLLATWRRELANRDFTSGVFARAMMVGDLTFDELDHGDLAELEARIRARGHEAYFFGKWLAHRDACHALTTRIGGLDLRAMLEAHDRFFAIYLGSQGLL